MPMEPPSPGLRPSDEDLTALMAVLRSWDGEPEDYRRALDASLPPVRSVTGLDSPAGLAICRELARALVRATVHGENVEVVEARWRDLGTVYAARGFPDEGYAAVARTLGRTARECADDGWSSRQSSRWAGMHIWMVSTLEEGAVRARQDGTDWHLLGEPPAGEDQGVTTGWTGPAIDPGAAEPPEQPDVPPSAEPAAPAQELRVDEVIGMVLGGSPTSRGRRRRW